MLLPCFLFLSSLYIVRGISSQIKRLQFSEKIAKCSCVQRVEALRLMDNVVFMLFDAEA